MLIFGGVTFVCPVLGDRFYLPYRFTEDCDYTMVLIPKGSMGPLDIQAVIAPEVCWCFSSMFWGSSHTEPYLRRWQWMFRGYGIFAYMNG